MKVTQENVRSYSIVFTDSEMQNLSDIKDVFDVAPDQVIERSVEEALTLGVQGVNKLIRTITAKKDEHDGDTSSDIRPGG